MSLRWKISAVIALVSTAAAVALSLTVHIAFARRQADEARRLQTERLDLVLREYARTGAPAFGGTLDDPDLPPELRRAAARGNHATLLDGDTIWAAAPAGGSVLSLASTYEDRRAQLASLDRVLLFGSLAVVACGTGAGVLIGARLSSRLRRAAAAARQVADGEHGTRVGDAVGDRARDETADLARAVDAMATALQARLDAERRVTADIAHELRTPLTGLTTAAELLPPSRPAELVRDRVGALRGLVEDVLEVARLDTATERADLSEVPLGAFTSRRVRALTPDAQVNVLTDTVVATDPLRLERILTNVLANATRHGAHPIEVEVDGPTITIRDHGPGFLDDLLQEGPTRFRKGSAETPGGHGLGLTIAKGQAAVLGATLTLTNHRTGGAQVTIHLPDRP
ncbi:HAMP domain-containing histidine kinase [Actinomadura madurae]|uniref:sensor histidine kinase n=1 Tax=Actinomadura madurae TaxID=1993 RepID=UPI00399AE7E3